MTTLSTTIAVELREAAAHLRARGVEAPSVGVVLGSGLGGFAEALQDPVTVPVCEVPQWPAPSVAGHAGRCVGGLLEGVRVVCLQGRVHAYEGYDAAHVVFAVRLLAQLGARAVLLTNAAGGIAPALRPGALMLITDHLNLTGRNPLVGADHAFVDLVGAYDPHLAEAARVAALELGVALHEGVYAGLLGPSYETPAEIRMLRTLGADAVGMSTVLEVIALRALGVRVGAVSCITNLAAGLAPGALSHEEVGAVAAAASVTFQALLRGWIRRCGGLVGSARL